MSGLGHVEQVRMGAAHYRSLGGHGLRKLRAQGRPGQLAGASVTSNCSEPRLR